MGASGSSSSSADTKAMKAQADSDYKAAKEKCKTMKGDEAKACEKDAKATHDKAQADMKAASKK